MSKGRKEQKGVSVSLPEGGGLVGLFFNANPAKAQRPQRFSEFFELGALCALFVEKML